MTPFKDALNQLGWNPAPEDPAGSAGQVDMSTISDLVSKTLAKASKLEDEDTYQAYFRNADISLYILAETAQRRDDDSAFIPYLRAYKDGNWQRNAFERVMSTSMFINLEEAQLWATRADRFLADWNEQGL